MELHQLRCPACGITDKLAIITENGQELWHCAYCGGKFTERSAEREYKKLEATIQKGLGSVVDAALKQEKTEKYYNLRSMLWGKITAANINSAAIVDICKEILSIAPHDFLAEFFELANSGCDADIADYINKIDVNVNALCMDVVLDFIIKSLKDVYITPTAALLERCGSIFDPKKKQEYLTRFEEEAAKVKDGIYELDVERHVFLAYSSKDMPAVVKLLNLIEENGLTCFAAFRNLQHGKNAVANYEQALAKAIDN